MSENNKSSIRKAPEIEPGTPDRREYRNKIDNYTIAGIKFF